MILIPEIETVVILVPRTGSGSLRRALASHYPYPRSQLIYRHMEADGVPAGYDRWKKVGVIRNPVDRLWSLYRYLQNFAGNHKPAYIESMRRCVAGQTFSEWVVNNHVPFTTPYATEGSHQFYPVFTVKHAKPENRKSQYDYLRPDLGTEIYPFERLDLLAVRLGLPKEALDKAWTGKTTAEPLPALSEEALDHIERFFAWDAVEHPRALSAAAATPVRTPAPSAQPILY